MPPSQREALALLGYFYLQNKRAQQAMTIFAALDVLAPDDRSVLTSLALSQIRAGKPERALNTLDRLAMRGFADGSFHLLRAQALFALERRPEASTAMNTYVSQRTSPAAAPSTSEATF